MSSPWRSEDLKAFHEALDAAMPDVQLPDLQSALAYALSGGKMLRPALTLAVGRAYRLLLRDLLPFMVALEYIHNYSLVHDDLPAMDDAKMRHGKGACHIVYGEGLAILIGDALLNAAYEVLFQAVSGSAERRAAQRLARAAGGRGMIGGQWLDLQAEAGGAQTSLDRLNLLARAEEIRERKTGALLEAAILMPLDLAHAPVSDEPIFRAYAESLGQAYQALDDIFDYAKAESELQKSSGRDLAKPTEPRLLGLQAAEENYLRLKQVVYQKLAHIEALPGLDTRELQSLTAYILERTY